jgi:hypothetical protein
MIGSYNAARLRHREHAVLLAPGPDFESDGIRMELQELWQGIQGNKIRIKRKPSAEKHKAPCGSVYSNPYKKSRTYIGNDFGLSLLNYVLYVRVSTRNYKLQPLNLQIFFHVPH